MFAVKSTERNQSFVQALMIMNCKYFVKKYDLDPVASVNLNNMDDTEVMTNLGYHKVSGPFANYSTKSILKSKI